MPRSPIYRLFLIAFILVSGVSYAQENNNDQVQGKDSIDYPIFKPIVSLSYGIVNFRGDVQSSLLTPLTGNNALQVNMATFIDRKNRYYIANFNILTGTIRANEYSNTNLERNLNFQTSIFAIGGNIEYRFGHIINKHSPIRPYINAGIESINFSAKGDLEDKQGNTYFYWSDGTIRDQSESIGSGNMLYRDYDFETDLRTKEETEFGLGNYSQRSLGFPVGAGIHFSISERAFFSLGATYHFTLSDYMDNVAYEGTSIKGKKGNDGFVFSHLSIHYDLFSVPAQISEFLHANAEYDPLFFDDEDGDLILDLKDRCPGTPVGIQVDTAGCPLDGDRDGVPDYRDREQATASGAWVDEQGVTVSEDEFYSAIESRNNAMARSEVDDYFVSIADLYVVESSGEIPEKFKALDEDEDGYISFEELLKTIDLYFDYQLELNIEEVKELNDFFFSQ